MTSIAKSKSAPQHEQNLRKKLEELEKNKSILDAQLDGANKSRLDQVLAGDKKAEQTSDEIRRFKSAIGECQELIDLITRELRALALAEQKRIEQAEIDEKNRIEAERLQKIEDEYASLLSAVDSVKHSYQETERITEQYLKNLQRERAVEIVRADWNQRYPDRVVLSPNLARYEEPTIVPARTETRRAGGFYWSEQGHRMLVGTKPVMETVNIPEEVIHGYRPAPLFDAVHLPAVFANSVSWKGKTHFLKLSRFEQPGDMTIEQARTILSAR